MEAQGRSDRRAQTYSIGDLAREFGVSLRTLRFYDDQGLLTPQRKGTVRLYDERHKARLSMVRLNEYCGSNTSTLHRSGRCGKRINGAQHRPLSRGRELGSMLDAKQCEVV